MNEEERTERSASTPETSTETKGAQAEPPKRSVLRLVIPLLVVIVIAGVLIWYFFLRGPAVPPNLIEVSGRIETDDSAVAAKTSGRIKEITVREGDHVTAGQVIATLDDEQVRAREEQAQAAVAEAQTRITRAQQQIAVYQEQLNQSNIGVEQARLDAQGRVRQAESQVSQAEAQLAQAEANHKQTSYDLEKFTRLYRTGDVPERQMIQARTANESQAKVVQAQRKQVDAARGALTAARANLANPSIRSSQAAAVRKQIAQAQSDIDAANAEADRAEAQLREAQANRNDLNIIAPFEGTVATRTAEPGEVVSPGAVIITLMNPGQIYLRAFVPEGDIGKVKVGQPARVYLDSNPNEPIDAEVSRIDPEASFTPENTYFRNERVKQVVGVKLIVKNPQGNAKPGMPADGEILVEGDWGSNRRQTKPQ
jgi:HlyD family secretion protein